MYSKAPRIDFGTNDVSEINKNLCSLHAQLVQIKEFYDQLKCELENSINSTNAQNDRYAKISEMTRAAIVLIEIIQIAIIRNHLVRWRCGEVLQENDGSSNFDRIQQWIQKLADAASSTITFIEVIEGDANLAFCEKGVKESIHLSHIHLVELMKSLIAASFIVEQQPPQMIQINAK